MSEIVCARCERRREPVGGTTMPGRWGRAVAEQVCAECWSDWLQEQTIVMNHYGLRPYVAADRQRLYELMAEFLRLRLEPAESGGAG